MILDNQNQNLKMMDDQKYQMNIVRHTLVFLSDKTMKKSMNTDLLLVILYLLVTKISSLLIY